MSGIPVRTEYIIPGTAPPDTTSLEMSVEEIRFGTTFSSKKDVVSVEEEQKIIFEIANNNETQRVDNSFGNFVFFSKKSSTLLVVSQTATAMMSNKKEAAKVKKVWLFGLDRAYPKNFIPM